MTQGNSNKGGGAFLSKAEAHRMIQAREDRLKPSKARQDFSETPGTASGWAFSRKALEEFLTRMKDKQPNSAIYFTLGHAEHLDAQLDAVPGTWRETLVVSDVQPFSAGATDADTYLEHPNDWP